MNNNSTSFSKTFQTLLSVPFTIVIWLIVYFLARGAIYLFDIFRGLDSQLIQGLFVELFTPGLGSYIALSANKKIFKQSNFKISVIFFLISFLIIYCFFSSILNPIYFNATGGFSKFLKFGLPFSTIIGSVIAYFKLKNMKHVSYLEF